MAPVKTFRKHMHDAAVEYIAKVLTTAKGDVPLAARLAGLHRATLYKAMARHGMVRGVGDGDPLNKLSQLRIRKGRYIVAHHPRGKGRRLSGFLSQNKYEAGRGRVLTLDCGATCVPADVLSCTGEPVCEHCLGNPCVCRLTSLANDA